MLYSVLNAYQIYRYFLGRISFDYIVPTFDDVLITTKQLTESSVYAKSSG